jgi:uncharacterized membrane protein
MRAAAKAMLAALFAVCVYRAFTQSLVHDEALTNELYITGPVASIFNNFDANHHFLNSALMRISAAIFGDSEWALRLPALGGAALYFTAVYRIALVAFGDGLPLLLAAALLSLNPFVLDFMVAARGYGLALALLMWALALLLEQFQAPAIAPKKLAWTGAALALSVTANLIFALPSAAVMGLALYLLPKPREPGEAKPYRKAKPAPKLWMWLTTPIAAIAVLFFLAAPVEKMRGEQFYTGAATLRESLRSLAASSLQHSGPLRHIPGTDLFRDAVAFGIAPLIAATGLAVGLWRRDLLLLFATAPLIFSGIALLLMHLVLGSPYPQDRTGIYFAPLVCLTFLGLARALPRASFTLYVAASLGAVYFAGEFNTRKFLVWEYDADTRTMGQYMAGHRGSKAVRVGGSWQLAESLSYYLFRNQWDWMEIESRPPEPGYDYYALIPQDAGVVQALGLKEVFRGPGSGSILAVPSTDSTGR